MRVSVGLGLTNACNLACAHCYRPDPPPRHLPLAAVRDVCESLDVAGVNLGTGESILHPELREILAYLRERRLRVSLTSNGATVAALADDELRALHDVEVSIDFADRARFDAFRGAGAWDAATAALERCRALGVRTTVLAVLMRDNHRDLAALARVVAGYASPLRVNLYQPVKSDRFAPTRDELWAAVADLLDQTTLLACSEPVVRAAAGLGGAGLACGHTSLRVMPSGELLPCVYWPEPAGRAEDVRRLGAGVFAEPAFRELDVVPPACRDCELVAACGGGCASRRRLTNGLDQPDPYCPNPPGGPRVRLRARLGDGGERLHTGNVCTLLVRG